MRSFRNTCVALALVTATPAIGQAFDFAEIADFDGDGRVTLAEYKSFAVTFFGILSPDGSPIAGAAVPPPFKGMFSAARPDPNGKISRAALLSSLPEKFRESDKGGKGWLSRQEMQSSLVQ